MSLQFRENIWAMQQTFFHPLPQTVQNPLVCIYSKMFRRISFFNILYIFVLSYFWEEGKEVEKYEMLIFWLRFFLHLYLYLCDWVMELTMFCQEGEGAFVCGWVRNCFVGSSFFFVLFPSRSFHKNDLQTNWLRKFDWAVGFPLLTGLVNFVQPTWLWSKGKFSFDPLEIFK